MNGKCASRMVLTNYYAFYQQCYAPQFQAIDILLKSMEHPLTVPETAGILHLSESEICRIMDDAPLSYIDKDGLLTLMTKGNSGLCRLFQRELSRGVKAVYSPEDIAYIYGLNEQHVHIVSRRLGQNAINAADVPVFLSQIHVFILY